MHYSTGDLGKVHGLTNEGVRFLEKMGIIHSTRDEKNGYRRFRYTDYVRMTQTKNYSMLGFSLEEIRSILDGELPLPETKELYHDKVAALEARKRQLEAAEKDLRQQMDAIRMLEAGEKAYHFAEAEPVIFCPRLENGALIPYPAHIQQANDQWANKAPNAQMLAVFSADGKSRMGRAMTETEFAALELPKVENLILLRPGLCACGAIEAPQMQRPDMESVNAWIRAQGRKATGDVICFLRMHVRGSDGKHHLIHEFYAPVKPQG